MTIQPEIQVINGEGTPRMLIGTDTIYTSKGSTTYDNVSVTEADGTSYTVLGITGAQGYPNKDILNVTLHDLDGKLAKVKYDGSNLYPEGTRIKIAGTSGNTPSLNGEHNVISVDASDTVTLDFTLDTASGAGGGTINRVSDIDGLVTVQTNAPGTAILRPPDTVRIASVTGGNPDINGDHLIIATISTDKFVIDLVFVSAGTGGTVKRLGDAEVNGIVEGMMLEATFTDIDNNIDEHNYAKVTGTEGNKILIDEWTFGTPATDVVFRITGWIIDLPRCQELTEYFTPDTLIHHLYLSKIDVEERGWFYKAELNYAQHIWGQTLLDAKRLFNTQLNTSLILLPRKDAPEFQYNVFFDPQAAIQLAMLGDSMGHRKVTLVFIGKETINNFPILEGYGTGYGNNYGNEL